MLQYFVAAAAAGSDESTDASDEDEVWVRSINRCVMSQTSNLVKFVTVMFWLFLQQVAAEAPVEAKSDITDAALSSDTASVNTNNSDDSDDDDDEAEESVSNHTSKRSGYIDSREAMCYWGSESLK